MRSGLRRKEVSRFRENPIRIPVARSRDPNFQHVLFVSVKKGKPSIHNLGYMKIHRKSPEMTR